MLSLIKNSIHAGALHEHFNTKLYTYNIWKWLISHRFRVAIRVCITLGPSIWDEVIFQFGCGGGRKDSGQGFHLCSIGTRKLYFFFCKNWPFLINQWINIRVFLEFLAIFMKVLLYFYLKSLIFFSEKVEKGVSKTHYSTFSEQSIVRVFTRFAAFELIRRRISSYIETGLAPLRRT